MAAEIVGYDKNVACRIGYLYVGKQCDVAFGIARGRTARELLAITDPQGSIDPHLLLAPAVVERSVDAMSVSRPARGWSKRAGYHWAEFVGTDGRRPCGRLCIV